MQSCKPNPKEYIILCFSIQIFVRTLAVLHARGVPILKWPSLVSCPEGGLHLQGMHTLLALWKKMLKPLEKMMNGTISRGLRDTSTKSIKLLTWVNPMKD